VVLPTPIPGKGTCLTRLSLWWFEHLADIPNHVRSATDVPEEFTGRAIRCEPLKIIPVECIARGFLTGSGLAEYKRAGKIAGIRLPTGLLEGSELPEPIFTPTTKAPIGGHDMPITFDQLVAQVGGARAEDLRQLALGVYRRGAAHAAMNGIIVADTKIEVGVNTANDLILADEVLTPDSSRFWLADSWLPGRRQTSLDKQIVRDWATGTGWDKTPPGPEIPPNVVLDTQQAYNDIYQRITGQV
jgi:phosphoribosylaminoimidazole-succinocarboxamide synthase